MLKNLLITVIASSILAAGEAIGGDGEAADLDRVKQGLGEVSDHAQYWQYGWTSFFAGSIALQARTLASAATSDAKAFDARVSLVTSGSGLLSTVLNPLPAAFLGDFHAAPEATAQERQLKAALGQRILDETWAEIHRRRSLRFQIFVVTEQILAAGAIASLDKRPQDAGRRFLLGLLTSELFIYTTPSAGASRDHAQISWQLLPYGASLAVKF